MPISLGMALMHDEDVPLFPINTPLHSALEAGPWTWQEAQPYDGAGKGAYYEFCDYIEVCISLSTCVGSNYYTG